MKEIEQPGGSPKKQEENLPEVLKERISDRYSIIERGALKYVVNSKKKIVSEGYHEFQIFKHGGMLGLIGKIGAYCRLLKMPDTEDGFFKESPLKFEDLRFDEGLGLLISKSGAYHFIVDTITTKKLSKGYHDFFMRGGKLYGKIGNKEEEVKLKAPERITDQKLIEDK